MRKAEIDWKRERQNEEWSFRAHWLDTWRPGALQLLHFPIDSHYYCVIIQRRVKIQLRWQKSYWSGEERTREKGNEISPCPTKLELILLFIRETTIETWKCYMEGSKRSYIHIYIYIVPASNQVCLSVDWLKFEWDFFPISSSRISHPSAITYTFPPYSKN